MAKTVLENIQENGANLYVGATWAVSSILLAAVLIFEVWQYAIGFNLISVWTPTPLVIACVGATFTLIAVVLALFSSTVRRVIFSVGDVAEYDDNGKSKDRAPNVSHGIIAASLALSVVFGIFWIVAVVAGSVWTHWWRTTEGTHWWMTDMTYGGLVTSPSDRTVNTLAVNIMLHTFTAMFQFAASSAILAFHMTEVTPYQMVRKSTSWFPSFASSNRSN